MGESAEVLLYHCPGLSARISSAQCEQNFERAREAVRHEPGSVARTAGQRLCDACFACPGVEVVSLLGHHTPVAFPPKPKNAPRPKPKRRRTRPKVVIGPCRKGHDRSVVGVRSDGHCAECDRLRKVAARERKRDEARARGEWVKPRPGEDWKWCQRGHPLVGDNVYELPDGRIRCRKCHNARCREYMRRRRATKRPAELQPDGPRSASNLTSPAGVGPEPEQPSA